MLLRAVLTEEQVLAILLEDKKVTSHHSSPTAMITQGDTSASVVLSTVKSEKASSTTLQEIGTVLRRT